MMKNLLIIIIVLFSSNIWSQTFSDTIWFDGEWKVKAKDSAVFFRALNHKEIRFKDFYDFKDFDLKGTKIKEGVSLKKEEDTFEGEVIYFHEDGSVSERKIFKNGFPFGSHKIYYNSGKLKTIRTYLFGILKGVSKTYSEKGGLLESGTYLKGKREGVWKTYYPNGKVKEQGLYKNDLKVGVWKVFYYNGASQE